MRRTITGFHRDEVGDWVAELSCLHGQHVRHRPPFWNAAWIEDDEQRSAKVGAELDCPLCDRAEMPDDLRATRTAPPRNQDPWDHDSAPAALRRTHRIASGVWGLLVVESGQLRFIAETEPALDVLVDQTRPQPIPPDVAHHVELAGDVTFRIEFLSR